MPIRVLTIAGTRPEVLKLSPVVRAIREGDGRIVTEVCFSGQQVLARGIAHEVGLVADHDLAGDDRPLSLSESLARLLERLDAVIDRARPAGVIVQGDTTTALAGAIAGFHHGLPVFHVEAGLRTADPARPFPEEMNRRLLTRLSRLHFAATEQARANLLREGIAPDAVFVTGNTVVDALQAFGRSGTQGAERLLADLGIESARALVLVTLHRRENAEAVPDVARAVTELARRPDVDVVWIRHPNATGTASAALANASGVRSVEPLPYATFVALLGRARFVLTDSGGVQEEAPVLGVPVIVLRRETDRPEAVLAGNAVVTGTDPAAIVAAAAELLDDAAAHAQRSRAGSPFGDGRAGARIANAIADHYFP